MSKNYDQIATVTIDLNAPLIDNTSFDNLLIFGPLPKVAPEKAPLKFGAYSSMDEVMEAGWSIIGEDADPVGLAAQVAFSQSPSPTVIYIAPMQLSEKAIASGKAIAEIKDIATANLHQDTVEGCTMEVDLDNRLTIVTLTSTVSEMHGSGIFVTTEKLKEAGYSVYIDGKEIKALKDLSGTELYNKISALKTDPDATHEVQFTAHVKKEGEDIDIPYGFIFRSVAADKAHSEVEPVFEEDLGDPAGELESPVLTLQRAMANSGWYVACPAGVDPKLYTDIADYIETQERMFCYTELDFFNNVGEDEAPKPAVGSVYLRTMGVYGVVDPDAPLEELPEANRYINVAMVAKWLNYESGSETAAFKMLQTIYPSELTTSQMKALADANLNYFIAIGNRNVTMNGKVLGDEWADVIRFRDWLKNDMQVRVVNLFISRPKIPYTDPGISLVELQMIASLNAGQRVGGIAPDEYDEDGTKIPGYVVTVPLAASLTAAERASRKLTGCKFTARLAGAIHFAELKGSLGYEIT